MYIDVAKKVTLTGSWAEYTYSFTVTDAMLENGIDFSALLWAADNVPVEYYAVKGITLTKVS